MAATRTTDAVRALWPARRWWTDGERWDLMAMVDGMLPGLRELRVEEELQDGMYVVRAEAPGIDPAVDADVTVDRGMVHISVERRREHTEDGRRGFRSEFRYGAFTRTLPLPEGCTEADVTATYHDGILEVRVPTSPATSSTAAKVAITRT